MSLSASILVSTDFSAAAAEATAYARRLADATGSDLHLLHVLPWPDAGPFETPGDAPTAAQEEAEEDALAQAALAEVARDVRAVSIAIRRGNAPAPEIAAHADEVGAGLLVVGRCGMRPQRPVLGPVTGELVQTAPCDVLVVPHHPGVPHSARAPRRVLLPVDFSDATEPLAALAAALAAAFGAGLDVVHVVEPLPHPLRWLDEALVDTVPQIRERAAQALRELADDELAGTETEVYVERGKATRTLPRVAEALGDDLIVIGPHAERPAFDRLLGSVAEGVVRRADCPVWVARRSAGGPDTDPTDDVDPHSYRPVAEDPA